MKLFNIRDLLKMTVPDAYELALFKLQSRLIFLAGHVKLRIDRYLYNERPIVQFSKIGDIMGVELIEPVFPNDLRQPEDQPDPDIEPDDRQASAKLFFVIGSDCREEARRIIDHIRSVNEQHVYRTHAVKSTPNPCIDDKSS